MCFLANHNYIVSLVSVLLDDFLTEAISLRVLERWVKSTMSYMNEIATMPKPTTTIFRRGELLAFSHVMEQALPSIGSPSRSPSNMGMIREESSQLGEDLALLVTVILE